MKKTVAIAALLIGALVAGYALRSQLAGPDQDRLAEAVDTANRTPASGDTAIAFTLPDLDGTLRDASEWQGRARLINFWATWCAPCRREIPLLKQTQAEHGELLQVIGIAVDYAEDVAAYAEEAAFNYPILVGQEEAMAVAESAGVEFIGLPFTMVVAADGRLIKTHVGEIVEDQIAEITGVLARLDAGELTLDEARSALGTL